MTPKTEALIEAAEAVVKVGDYPITFAMLEAVRKLDEALRAARAEEGGVEEQVTALKVENDRLQTTNAALRRSLEDIANQYAVDCL